MKQVKNLYLNYSLNFMDDKFLFYKQSLYMYIDPLFESKYVTFNKFPNEISKNLDEIKYTYKLIPIVKKNEIVEHDKLFILLCSYETSIYKDYLDICITELNISEYIKGLITHVLLQNFPITNKLNICFFMLSNNKHTLYSKYNISLRCCV